MSRSVDNGETTPDWWVVRRMSGESDISAVSLDEDELPPDISAVSLDDDELPPKANALEDLQKSERSNDFQNATQVPAELDDYMDWALQYVGDWGYFQRCGCAIVAAVNIVCGAQIMAHIFGSLPPQMRHNL